MQMNFPSILQITIKEGSYDSRLVFSLDEIGLFWKTMSSQTFISVEEETAPRFKVHSCSQQTQLVPSS
jgi:hypothetical protein